MTRWLGIGLALLFAGSANAVATDKSSAVTPADDDTLRVFFVGNSHANNARLYLDELAAAAGVTIRTGIAFIGGGRLDQHAEALAKNTARYRGKTLVDLLTAEPWDYVSIQQASSDSWDVESFRPHAAELADAIRRHAPQAELLLHVTWSRHPTALAKSKTPHTTVAENQQAIESANAQIQAEIGHPRSVHTGRALLRAYQDPQSGFSLSEPPSKDPPFKTFHRDGTHLNAAGSYLTACVWFAFLTGQSPEGNSFVPDELTPEQARTLQRLAWESQEELRAAPDK